LWTLNKVFLPTFAIPHEFPNVQLYVHTSTVFVAEVGKPPDVAQSHGHGYTREQKVQLVRETPSLLILLLKKLLKI
jgi:hypothetical protein